MLTNHARDRMAEKGITLAQVRRVIETGHIQKCYSTFYCWDDEITVMVRANPRGKRDRRDVYTITTVFRTRGRGRGLARLRRRWLNALAKAKGD